MSLATLDQIIELSGLPKTYASEKLSELIAAHGFDQESLNIEQIRIILADYLQTLILEDSSYEL